MANPSLSPAVISRFWSKVSKETHPKGCWLWTASKNKFGYGNFSNRDQSLKAHRVAYELSYGEIPEGLCVCHSCDNPSCVNPEHLWIGTNAENNADMLKKGRQVPALKGDQHPSRTHPELWARGERVNTAKLKAEQIRDIRRRHNEGASQASLARKFQTTRQAIGKIVRRENWRHIE